MDATAQPSGEANPEAATEAGAQAEEGEARRARRLSALTQEQREEQAQNLYAAGERAFFEQEYEQAVQMWRRAFELCGHAGLVYNMGTAEMHQGHRREAVRLYREFLVMSPETDARPSVETRISELLGELSRPPVIVEPGPFEGRFWTWIALGTAGAAGGAAAGFWASANSRREALVASCGQTPGGCTGSEIGEVTARVSATNMALSFSVAAVIAAVGFYFFEAPEPRVESPDDEPDSAPLPDDASAAEDSVEDGSGDEA